MIDIHCHLLPAVDDGSKSMDETLGMLEVAIRDGVSIIAATPHANPGYHNVSRERVLELVGELNERHKEEEFPRIVPGHDAHLTPELPEQLRSGSVLTLNFSRYFLLEPPEHFRPLELKEAVFQFMTDGFVPIITHPERIGAFMRHPEIFTPLIEQGALIQVTAGSITGYFGERVQRFTEHLLHEGYAQIVASDAHSPRHRPPILSSACTQMKEWGLDPEPYVSERPKAILNNEELEIPMPERRVAKKSSFIRRIFRR